MKGINNMKKFIIILALALSATLFLSSCASWSSNMKSMACDFNGGLNRTVTVYSYNGDVLGQWSGKFAVSESPNVTFFDINDKRVIIHGGIIINEEN